MSGMGPGPVSQLLKRFWAKEDPGGPKDQCRRKLEIRGNLSPTLELQSGPY